MQFCQDQAMIFFCSKKTTFLHFWYCFTGLLGCSFVNTSRLFLAQNSAQETFLNQVLTFFWFRESSSDITN